MKKRLVILGAPGAGKGTQARNICELLAIPTFSTGAMLRAQMQAGTELGNKAKELIDRGELVPDSVIGALVEAELKTDRYRGGFLADGYPRNLEQARFLDQVLKDMGTQLDAVINLDVNLEDVVGRLLKRAEIEHRSDDTEPVIRRRLQVYQEQTEPLVRYYREADLLINIDGNGSIDQVWDNIAAQLQ